MSVVNFDNIRDVFLTDTQLTALKQEADKAFGEAVNSLFISKIYGARDKNFRLYSELYLYRKALENWNQWNDGSDTGLYNGLSRKQFSNIVNRMKLILRG